MRPSRLALFVVVTTPLLGGVASLGCAAPADDTSVSEDDVASRVRLEAIATPPAVATAAADIAAGSGLVVEVAAFRYDTTKAGDPSKVASAVRSKLAYPRLRRDEGKVDAAVLDATLDEYGATDPAANAALAKAVREAVGETAHSQKLWLRSDDVRGADSEWAEVVFVWVSPDRGTALRLTLRYEA